MLGTVARSVVGVDIALDTVAHATAHYARRNVTFRAGDCAAIPLDDASVDVVVSFETIEHHAHHEEMLREIRRVLRPGGLMILSSPERFEYSERPGTNNPFHVRELYRQEFVDLVARHFPHSDLYHQKILFGSAILAERIATPTTSLHTDEPFDEPASGLPRPVYLIAVASDGALPTLSTGVFEQPLAESSEWAFWIDTVADRDRMIHKLDASATVAEQRAAALGEQLRTAQDERLKVNEQLLDAHDRLIRANEQRLTAQEEIAASREQLIASQRDVATNEGHLSDARREVATTQARLLEAQALIATSHGQLAEAHERQRQHETEFRELQRRCGDSDEGSERDRLALQALEQQLRAANEQVADARQQARQIEHSLHLEQEARRAVYASTSWRITSPLRTAKDLLRAPPRIGRTALRLVLNAIKKVYHGIPVSRDAKHRAKDLFFSTFAFALKRTGSYQAWVRWQNRDLDYVPDVIRQLAANDTLIAEPSAIAPTYSAAGTPLWDRRRHPRVVAARADAATDRRGRARAHGPLRAGRRTDGVDQAGGVRSGGGGADRSGRRRTGSDHPDPGVQSPSSDARVPDFDPTCRDVGVLRDPDRGRRLDRRDGRGARRHSQPAHPSQRDQPQLPAQLQRGTALRRADASSCSSTTMSRSAIAGSTRWSTCFARSRASAPWVRASSIHRDTCRKQACRSTPT